MSASVILGQSLKITVTFRAFSGEPSAGEPVDPVSVAGYFRDADLVQTGTFTPTHLSTGVYQYIWVPNALGDIYVEFVGTFADATVDEIRQFYTVIATSGDFTVKLGEDQYLQFMPKLTGVELDPDEILAVYPDASPIDVMELLYIFSHEVATLLGTPSSSWNTTAFEYIKAATLCSLSKVFDLAAGDSQTFTLGDLTVVNQHFSNSSTNRGNATTWCELAAALRIELVKTSKGGSIKAIVKGSNFPNPIPVRQLRSHDD